MLDPLSHFLGNSTLISIVSEPAGSSICINKHSPFLTSSPACAVICYFNPGHFHWIKQKQQLKVFLICISMVTKNAECFKKCFSSVYFPQFWECCLILYSIFKIRIFVFMLFKAFCYCSSTLPSIFCCTYNFKAFPIYEWRLSCLYRNFLV